MSHLIPQPLKSKLAPFDHPDWIFELKYDGFHAVAHVENERCQLISRNGAKFASFSNLSADIARSLGSRNAVLDGEIVCLDSKGYPQFRDLLFHRGEPCFFCFEMLECDGKDFRLNALIRAKKAELRRVLSIRSPYVTLQSGSGGTLTIH
jgi:bifunctional non-homologous end joining protein LigD